jgi:competence protein ComEC
MATLVLLSFIFQRNSHVLNSLGIAGIVWLIISPTSLFTPGFQLSFAATFGIIALHPIFSSLYMPSSADPVIQFLTRVPVTSFYVSLSGFIATVPVLVYHFGRISLYGLIANILAVILMGCAMNTFFIGIVLQLVWEPLSAIFMRITEFLLTILSKIAEFSHFISFSSIKVPVVFREYFYMYTLFFLGLILVNKKHRINYLYRAAPFLLLLVPAIIFIHSFNPHTEITFFSTKKGSVTGIKFPNNNIWLVGSAPHGPYSNPFINAVEPWLHHTMIKKFDAILLPSTPQNIIHDLDPILAEYRPNTIISCRKPDNEILHENFQSFLHNYHVDNLEAHNRWRFIPAMNCTCFIYIEECENKWYEECSPAMVKFSIGNIKMLFSETEPISLPQNNEYDIIKTKDSIYINSINSFNDNEGKNIFTSYSVESDGAVSVNIKNKRIKKVSTMSRLF